MQIDKTIGKWYDGKTELDDFAYQLYIEYTKSFTTIHLELITPQSSICSIYHHGDGNDFINGFFDEAKLILRREKIQKILSRGNR